MNQHAAPASTPPVGPPPAPDIYQGIHELIAYCEGLQALVGSAPDERNVFDYLTPFSFHMLIEPVSDRLKVLREQLADH